MDVSIDIMIVAVIYIYIICDENNSDKLKFLGNLCNNSCANLISLFNWWRLRSKQLLRVFAFKIFPFHKMFIHRYTLYGCTRHWKFKLYLKYYIIFKQPKKVFKYIYIFFFRNFPTSKKYYCDLKHSTLSNNSFEKLFFIK